MRTDENRNPTAFTVNIAREAGLAMGVDYIPGTPFPLPATFVTAKLIGDPVEITIRVIDKIGFYTTKGSFTRWAYIAMPQFVWNALNHDQKRKVIGFMYQREGGLKMHSLFDAPKLPVTPAATVPPPKPPISTA